jgi:hypothetical protein
MIDVDHGFKKRSFWGLFSPAKEVNKTFLTVVTKAAA